MLDLAAAFLGFTAGLLVWSQGVRWVLSVRAVLKQGETQGLGVAVPMVAILHSGPWMLALAAFFTVYILRQPHHSAWVWFFSGALCVPPFMVLTVLRALRGIRKKRGLDAQP